MVCAWAAGDRGGLLLAASRIGDATRAIIMLLQLSLAPLLVAAVGRPIRHRAIGWYDSRAEMIANVPPESLDLSVYTHVAFGGPSLAPDGTVQCTGYTDGIGATLRNRTLAAGGKMIWIMTDETSKLLCSNCTHVRQRFVATARVAMKRCGADGIEFDYEGPGSSDAADVYTDFLVSLKAAIGPDLVVSADIAVWTDFPWVNPKHPGYATLDYLNIMTYYWSATGSINKYEEATAKLRNWGFPLASLNLGLPFYTSKQNSWGGLSASCPNVATGVDSCGGALFVGKDMCTKIGEHVQREGYGGVFPWCVTVSIFALLCSRLQPELRWVCVLP